MPRRTAVIRSFIGAPTRKALHIKVRGKRRSRDPGFLTKYRRTNPEGVPQDAHERIACFGGFVGPDAAPCTLREPLLQWGPTPQAATAGTLMHEVTQLLSAIDQGDPQAAEQLLPLVYEELRTLAAQKLAQEKPGQTLEATALVHEAYLRLLGGAPATPGSASDSGWDNRRHFFAAAAEAMRRILIEAARRKGRRKNQGDRLRVDLDDIDVAAEEKSDQLLAVNEAVERLTATDPRAAELVKLRYFAGFTNADAASILGISPRKANQIWAYARAWLLEELAEKGQF